LAPWRGGDRDNGRGYGIETRVRDGMEIRAVTMGMGKIVEVGTK